MGGLKSRLWVQFRGSCSDLPCWELGGCFLSLGGTSWWSLGKQKIFLSEHSKSTHRTDSFSMKSLTWCFSYVLSSVNSLLLLYKPQHSGLKQQFINKHDNSVCWLVSARKQSWICSQMQAAQGYRAESEWTVLWFPHVAGIACWPLAKVTSQPLPCDPVWFGLLREWGRGSERKCFKGQFSQGPGRTLAGFLWCGMGSPRLPLPLHWTGRARLPVQPRVKTTSIADGEGRHGGLSWH